MRGLDALFALPQVILVGEAHGTVEIPAFVARLSCEGLARGLQIGVGFECYGDQGGAFRRFMDSDGSPQARAALVAAPHFDPDPDVADGRSSVAMVEMFEQLRRQRQAGGSVFVFPVGPVGDERASGERDQWMAQRVVDARRVHPDAMLIVLAGGGHTAIKTVEDQPGVGNSMGWFLTHEHQLPLVSLGWLEAGGTSWSPFAVDHLRRLPGEDLGREPFIDLRADAPYVDGTYYLGPTTASPPARYPDALTVP